MKIRAKCRRSLQNYWGWLNKEFSYGWNRWNVTKARKSGALPTETKRRWKAIFHFRAVDSKETKKGFFFTGVWLRMRNWYFMTTLRWKNTTLCADNRCYPPPHQHKYLILMVSGGTKMVCWKKHMSCWNLDIPLHKTGIDYNIFVWAEHSEKSGRNISKYVTNLFLCIKMPGFMSQKS